MEEFYNLKRNPLQPLGIQSYCRRKVLEFLSVGLLLLETARSKRTMKLLDQASPSRLV